MISCEEYYGEAGSLYLKAFGLLYRGVHKYHIPSLKLRKYVSNVAWFLF